MGAFPTGFQLGQNGRKHRRLGGYEALQVERIGSGQFQFPTDAVRLLVAAGLVAAASSIHVVVVHSLSATHTVIDPRPHQAAGQRRSYRRILVMAWGFQAAVWV